MKLDFFSKLLMGLFLTTIALSFSQTMLAQAPPALPDTSRMTFDQISTGLRIVVFPANGQSRQKQKEDEFECYKWGM